MVSILIIIKQHEQYFFPFRQTSLLSARSSQSHVTLWSSLMFHHQFNNKCNRVKGRRWRWLIYALPYVIFYYEICYVFSEATTTALESFTNSTGKHLCWSLLSKKLQVCRPVSCLFFSIPDNSFYLN